MRKLSRHIIEEIKGFSGYSEYEVNKLFYVFEALNPHNGVITVAALERIPQLKLPLFNHLPRALKLKPDAIIDFKVFAQLLRVFHPFVPEAEKLDFLFSIYDRDIDGYISKSDLNETLTHILGSEDPLLIEYAVEKTFLELSSENADLTLENFAHGLSSLEASQFLTFGKSFFS